MNRIQSAFAIAGFTVMSVGRVTNTSLQRQNEAQSQVIRDLQNRNRQMTDQYGILLAENQRLRETGGARGKTDVSKAKTDIEAKVPGATVSERDGNLIVTLPSKILFDAGKSSPTKSGAAALKQMGDILKTDYAAQPVRVDGHTDNQPIKHSGYKSNWELSSARAIAVLHELAKLGVDEKKLSFAGYGEHRPVAPNATEEGRKQNRRVEIVIAQ